MAQRLIALCAAGVAACRGGSTPPDDDDDASADAPEDRTSCPLADGHPCSRWVLTSPNDEYACLGYDNLGTVCQ